MQRKDARCDPSVTQSSESIEMRVTGLSPETRPAWQTYDKRPAGYQLMHPLPEPDVLIATQLRGP